MTVSFDGRVVIVTGGGGALGRTHALDIAARGGSVVVSDLGGTADGTGSSPDLADAVVAEIVRAGGRAVPAYDDAADTAGAGAIVETALSVYGRVDAVINNAGNLRNAWIEDLTDEDRDSILRNHLIASMNMTRAVWPQLKSQGYGRIVYACSSAGMFGNGSQAAYGAAKAGIAGLMNVVAQEGQAHGILCNGLMPNAISRLGAQMFPEVTASFMPYVSKYVSAMAPEFNTGVAVYLASEACQTTRSLYSSAGGRIARVFIGVTEGWDGSIDTPATADDIAAHIDEIRDPSRGYQIPLSLVDEHRMRAESLGEPTKATDR